MENQKNISLNQLFEKLRSKLKKILSLARISVIVTFVGAVIGVIQLCRPDYSKLTSELLKTAIEDYNTMSDLHIPEEYLDDDVVVKNIKAYIDSFEAFKTAIQLLEFSPLNDDVDIQLLFNVSELRAKATISFINNRQRLLESAKPLLPSLQMLDFSIFVQALEADQKYYEIVIASESKLEQFRKNTNLKDGVSKKEKRELIKLLNTAYCSKEFYNSVNSSYILSKHLYKSCKLKIQQIVTGNDQEHSSPELNI